MNNGESKQIKLSFLPNGAKELIEGNVKIWKGMTNNEFIETVKKVLIEQGKYSKEELEKSRIIPILDKNVITTSSRDKPPFPFDKDAELEKAIVRIFVQEQEQKQELAAKMKAASPVKVTAEFRTVDTLKPMSINYEISERMTVQELYNEVKKKLEVAGINSKFLNNIKLIVEGKSITNYEAEIPFGKITKGGPISCTLNLSEDLQQELAKEMGVASNPPKKDNKTNPETATTTQSRSVLSRLLSILPTLWNMLPTFTITSLFSSKPSDEIIKRFVTIVGTSKPMSINYEISERMTAQELYNEVKKKLEVAGINSKFLNNIKLIVEGGSIENNNDVIANNTYNKIIKGGNISCKLNLSEDLQQELAEEMRKAKKDNKTKLETSTTTQSVSVLTPTASPTASTSLYGTNSSPVKTDKPLSPVIKHEPNFITKILDMAASCINKIGEKLVEPKR